MTTGGEHRDEVISRLRAYLSTSLPGRVEDVEALAEQDSLWELMGSLTLLELVDWAEQSFEVEIPPADFTPDNVGTLDALARLIVGRSGGGAA